MFKKRESPYSIPIFAVTSKVSSNVTEEFYHFHHPKKIMFTVAHACFLKIGSAEWCWWIWRMLIRVSEKALCVWQSRRDTDRARGEYTMPHAHSLKRGRVTSRHQCLLMSLGMRSSHSPRFWVLDVYLLGGPRLQRHHLHLNDWSPKPADNRL